MKKGLKKIVSLVLASALTLSCMSFTGISLSAADNYISEEKGCFESAYVEWNSVPDATGFAAYVKGAGESDSAYVQLDDELIRKYPTYFRADAVGLKAGQYVMKVVPYINGTLDQSKAFVSGTLDVKAYDRSGFAFSSDSTFKTGSGAYNDDGTLRNNAKVFYITKDTAKTVTADVIVDSKGTTQSFTGFQSIVTAKQKGYDKTPFDFRLIGTIEDSDMDKFDSSAEGLQIKGKNSYAELNITIEGIGEDAGIRGFGILARNAGNVELRNFAVMLCMDDCISLDTDNANIWIHNIDLFYGKTGGDSDQAKGDGTIDVKGDSKYITIAYNHLYDSGKASLCGMTSESGPNYITYHHNWFDHSDSRHPRIRTMSVHVYNNYYDGNSKYGVGAAKNSNAFVESNYFENCKHPMLSSKQGSDIMENSNTGAPDFSAKGTFSGEDGGIIKAYNNYVIGSDADKYNGGVEPVYYDAADTKTNGKATQFDAYLATSRDEKVPSTVKTVQGGTSYDNFDTSVDLGVDAANITPVMDVPSVVKASAGRINGGDFPVDRSIYTGLTDAASYDVDTQLKADITAYQPTLVSVGGKNLGGTVETTESTTAVSTESTTAVSTEATTEATTNNVTTEATTKEETTETTTISGEVVTFGEAVTGFESDSTGDTGAGTSVVYNAATDTWTLTDTSKTAAATLELPFAGKDTGKLIFTGSATPSTNSGKWAFLQIRGLANEAIDKSELISIASDANKNLSVRTNGSTYTSFGEALTAGKTYNFTIVLDIDTGVADVTINGVTKSVAGIDVDTVSSINSVTSKTSERNVSLTGLKVVEVSEVTTETTTETTTEATTATETTTEATTTTEETSTEATTAEPVDPPTPVEKVYGDADANGVVDSNDAAVMLQYVLNGTPYANETEYVDVYYDGKIDTKDIACVIQYILDSSYTLPIYTRPM